MRTMITHIQTLLHHYTPWDSAETHARDHMLTFLNTPAPQHMNPWIDRHNVNPGHFTASALVLSPCGRNIALIMHRKLQMWLQPGGHIESTDHDVVAAAQREVHEECGLAETSLVQAPPPHHAPVLFHLDVHTIPATTRTPAHRHFDLRVLLQAHTTELVAASDADAAQWYPLTHIAQLPTDASVRRAAEKLRLWQQHSRLSLKPDTQERT